MVLNQEEISFLEELKKQMEDTGDNSYLYEELSECLNLKHSDNKNSLFSDCLSYLEDYKLEHTELYYKIKRNYK